VDFSISNGDEQAKISPTPTINTIRLAEMSISLTYFVQIVRLPRKIHIGVPSMIETALSMASIVIHTKPDFCVPDRICDVKPKSLHVSERATNLSDFSILEQVPLPGPPSAAAASFPSACIHEPCQLFQAYI
jgi:hypothetical protein